MFSNFQTIVILYKHSKAISVDVVPYFNSVCQFFMFANVNVDYLPCVGLSVCVCVCVFVCL